jgi:single-stranded-DNA-specific exonuclease
MSSLTTEKVWQQKEWNHEKAEKTAKKLNIPLPVCALLQQRGLEDPDAIEKFLYPSLDHLPSPFLMKGVQSSVEILVNAINHNHPVAIYGDYDVDGTTGTAVIALFLREAGLNAKCYQPDRLKDGYGLHKNLIDTINQDMEKNTSLNPGKVLITVDCGISNVKETEYAQSLGFTVIVTDHHQPEEQQLPHADAVINPWQPCCTFPHKGLAGVGVAFYLVMALRNQLTQKNFWPVEKIPNLKDYLGLVAIGTIADMVPLTGPNRVMVKAGLEVLNDSKRPGLRALLTICNLSHVKITAEHVAFQVCPRLNAPGRLNSPEKSLRLLLSDDSEACDKLVREIDKDNQKRKLLSEELFKVATKLAEEKFNTDKKTIVIKGDNWPLGLVGIVATKISKLFYRPTIVLSKINGIYKGSGRSIDELNLLEAVKECKEYCLNLGGHKGAIGLSIKKENLSAFTASFEKVTRVKLSGLNLTPKMAFDLKIDKEFHIDTDFLKYIYMLQPFGNGNPEPTFTINIDKLSGIRSIGNNHVKFFTELNHTKYDTIGFNLKKHSENLINSSNRKMAFNLKLNSFKGREEWQINALDFKFDNVTL